MRQSSSFFIFKYSSEVIGCASDSFFLFPQLIVITKSSLLFYDGIELGLRAVQKREFSPRTESSSSKLLFLSCSLNALVSNKE